MQTSSSLQLFDATWIYFLGSRTADNFTRARFPHRAGTAGHAEMHFQSCHCSSFCLLWGDVKAYRSSEIWATPMIGATVVVVVSRLVAAGNRLVGFNAEGSPRVASYRRHLDPPA